ncbi:MAG: RNA polymerase sigma-70 factor [Bacteroidales bacterium]|nr:RNA polymerase sigma-70 factor [Bacteroidales bacterium]
MNAETVAARIRNGQREAFDELFSAQWPSLVSYASMMLGSRADGQDVVQAVFLNLWKNRGNLQDDTPMDAYLMRAVYNRSLNIIRSGKVRRTHDSVWSARIREELSVCYDPDRNDVMRRIFGAEARQAIQDAIETLPERCREIFRMRYEDGRSASEVAGILGISVSTVNNQVFKALGLLRKDLGFLKVMVLFFVILFK